jgi:hypothetical protein
MTIEPSNFLNGHGQSDHFGFDHNTILSIAHGQMVKLTDISTILTIEPQFGQNGQKNFGHQTPPPLNVSPYLAIRPVQKVQNKGWQSANRNLWIIS